MADYENSVDIVLEMQAKAVIGALSAMNKGLKTIQDTSTATINKLTAYAKPIRDLSLAAQRLDNIKADRAKKTLTDITSGIAQLGSRMNNLGFQQFQRNVNSVSDTLSRLNNSFKAISKLPTVFDVLKNADFTSFDKIDVAPVQRLVTELGHLDATNLKGVGNAINNIARAMNAMQNLNMDISLPKNVQSQMNTAADTLKGFIEKIAAFNLNGLKGFARDIKAIPTAMSKMEKLDVSKIGQVFSTLTTQIQPFLAHLKEASVEIQGLSKITASIDRFNRGMRSARTATKELGNEATVTHKRLNNMLSFGKIYALYNQLRHFGSGFANMLNKAIDFTEIENYFSRAMGNMRSEAMKFQNQLSDMYGLAMPSMMQAQATFKNQLGALGDLSEDMSYMLSERLTKMSLDYASLYNVSVDSAVTKFQAALSKQVRPIRSQSGYDITQSVLGGTLESIGIYDRQIRDLSEVEKRLIIILTLQQQMARSAAMGDFARTIEQPANQLKILQQQIAEVGRWISAVFYGVIGKVLPYINGFVMAIKSLIQMFASFLGYELPDSSGSTGSILDSMDDSLGGVSDGMDDVNAGIDDANKGLDSAKKKTKEWKNFLAGFDVANVIPDQSTDDSSSGSGGGDSSGAGGMSIDPRLLKALQDMDYIFDNIRMKAMDIRDRLLEWASILGRVVDDNIFEPIRNSWNKYGAGILQNIKETRDNIVHILGGVFDVVEQKWKPFFQAASDLFFSLLDTASLVTDTISTFFRHVWDSGGKYLFEALWDLATAFLKLATSINDNFVKPVVKGLKNTLVPVFGNFTGIILKGIGAIIKGFANVITWISKCKPVVVMLSTVVTSFFLAWKLTKFAEFISLGGGVVNVLKNIATGMITGNGVIGKAATAITSLKAAYSLVNGTMIEYLAKMGLVTIQENIADGTAKILAASHYGLAAAEGAASGAAGILGTALNFLAAHPLVVLLTAIGAIAGGLALFCSSQKEAKYEMDDYSKSVQDQINALDELKKSMDEAKASTDKEISSKMAEYKRLEQNVDILRRMAGETGYVDSIEQAKQKVEAINKELPGTVKLTKEGRIEWLKTPDAIQKNIDKLKEKARQEAYEKLYVQYIQAQIEAEAKQAESRDKLNKLSERKLELSKQIQQAAADGDSEKLGKLSDDLNQVNADLDGTEKALKKANDAVDAAKKKQDGLDKTLGNVSSSTNGLTEELGKFYAQFGLSDKKAAEFEKLATKMKETNKVMDSCMKDGKVINKKEYDDTKKTRQKLVKEYAEKAKKYKLSSKDIIDIAKKNGVNLSKEELEQARNSLKNAEQSKKDITKVKKQQNAELLSLLDKLGIDKDSKLGKQYQAELKKAQENGTKSGEDYIKNIKKGISNGDISPDAQAQWNKGQKIFDNPLIVLAKVMGADSAGNNAWQTMNRILSKTIWGKAEIGNKSNAAWDAYNWFDSWFKAGSHTIWGQSALGNKSNAANEALEWFQQYFRKHPIEATLSIVSGSIDLALGKVTGWMQKKAEGGFVDTGQMFIAREAGPELVGTMGGRTAVANNDQITSGIYRAVLQALRDGGGFQDRGGDLYITIQNEDGSKTTKIIKDYKKQMIFSGGKGGVPV
ncbi:hypothetical protein DWX17_13140 [[Clostridium] innocuum]|jgi:hypothetical protein|uniref:hypothetical protein n=1 Tax=Clostridium innocuum TaxID=1522 RepID=UPI000E4A5DE1|nr:hypothetical protein [[Clostridium] innocuum]RGT66937.1 hypothetical protein DWX17_13140 [[Clostridium] innocuum]